MDAVVEEATIDLASALPPQATVAGLVRQGRLKAAGAVILPMRKGAEGTGEVYFAPETRSLLRFLDSKQESIRVEVASDSESPDELLIRGDIVVLGTLLVQYVAVPVFVGLLVDYVKNRLRGSNDQTKDTVRCEIVIPVDGGKAKSFYYDGPASTFESVFASKVRESTDGTD